MNRNKTKKAAMSLIVTEGCNLRCDYCFNKAIGYKNAFMSVEMAKKAIDLYWEMFNLGKNGIKDSSITFFGGEPLLNKQVVLESAKYIRALDEKSGIETKIVLMTNGTLVTKEFSREAKRYNLIVIVSLDSSETNHNEHRKDKFGKGSFDKVTKGLEILKKEGCEIIISTVLTPSSVSGNNILLPIIKEFGVKEMSMKPLIESMDIDSYIQGVVKYAIKHFEEAKKIGIDEFQVSAIKKSFVLGFPVSEGTLDCKCFMYDNQIVVWTDGAINTCEKMKDSSIGNLQTSIRELIQNKNELAEKLKQRLPTFNEECEDCEFNEICGGGCAFTARCITGDLMKKDPLNCAYSKEIWRLLGSKS